MRRALARDVQSLGHNAVATATSLEASWALQQRRLPSIQAAVVDLFLGGEDGTHLLAFLADQYPSVRRVLLSGAVRSCQLELALASGRAHAVLEKPWSMEGLALAIGVG
jgi:CheY-like chemotaxis protein